MLKDYDIKIIFTLSVPILTKQENWLEIFIFTRLCGASKGFMKCTGREGLSVMWTEWNISFRVCDLRCVKHNTEKKPNLTILTSLKSQNFLCQPWQSTFNKDVYPWSGGRGKDSSSDWPPRLAHNKNVLLLILRFKLQACRFLGFNFCFCRKRVPHHNFWFHKMAQLIAHFQLVTS